MNYLKSREHTNIEPNILCLDTIVSVLLKRCSLLKFQSKNEICCDLRKEVPDPTFCLDKAAYCARTFALWAAAASIAELERIIDDGEGETMPRRKPSAEQIWFIIVEKSTKYRD